MECFLFWVLSIHLIAGHKIYNMTERWRRNTRLFDETERKCWYKLYQQKRIKDHISITSGILYISESNTSSMLCLQTKQSFVTYLIFHSNISSSYTTPSLKKATQLLTYFGIFWFLTQDRSLKSHSIGEKHLHIRVTCYIWELWADNLGMRLSSMML